MTHYQKDIKPRTRQAALTRELAELREQRDVLLAACEAVCDPKIPMPYAGERCAAAAAFVRARAGNKSQMGRNLECAACGEWCSPAGVCPNEHIGEPPMPDGRHAPTISTPAGRMVTVCECETFNGEVRALLAPLMHPKIPGAYTDVELLRCLRSILPGGATLCRNCGKLPPHQGCTAICAACAPPTGACTCAACKLVAEYIARGDR